MFSPGGKARPLSVACDDTGDGSRNGRVVRFAFALASENPLSRRTAMRSQVTRYPDGEMCLQFFFSRSARIAKIVASRALHSATQEVITSSRKFSRRIHVRASP